ncbi:class I SAM-dependent methyltransferase [Methylotetracoccus oryzae]|uniref:class I SAM-dependent methyltransferase n=1 Tax=Methylotetracoccus oryzae TaxID=1919059 RepID=UPI0013A59AB9|nr:class I SAM-dependent methyltransferase [Methylotetracoccus oryzae]
MTELAGVSPRQIVLHVVNAAADPGILARLSDLNVDIVPVDAYPDHPYCNKLQQLPCLAERIFDDVVLLDCDVIVLEEPPLATGCAMGKPVDFERPGIAIVERLFAEAGLPLIPAVADVDGGKTVRGNVNGGVYLISRDVFAPLASEWRKWAAWCLKRRAVFDDQWMHIDQIAFAMAITALRTPFADLERRYNVPTHVRQPPALDCDPAILHYHQALDDQFFLRPVPDLPKVNTAINEVNRRLENWRREHFDNSAFWNARYLSNPRLGSGVGSRGATLAVKRRLLAKVVELLGARTVLDIGGGDGQTVSELPSTIGVHAADLAVAARPLYLQANPHATWVQHDITDAPLQTSADLLICFDLLIHLSSQREYRAAIRHLLAQGKPVLLSGFDDQPVATGPMTYFHEALSESLSNEGFMPIPVGAYRGLLACVALPAHSARAARDITDATLRRAAPLVDDPLLLLEALCVSRAKLGFFPNHLPRCIEYPWIIQRLAGRRDLRIIEAGAGVSVLPFLLADRGHSVITADPHPTRRNDTSPESWNEWGFLDYAELDPRIRSVNIAYQDLELHGELVDAVVSVSVIEHLTRDTRLAWISKAFHQLKPGGSIVLTVDTVPFTRNLWCYSEGREVEDPVLHGTLDSMLQELAEAGFKEFVVEHAQWLPQSRVGMGRIEARKPQ